MSLNISDQLTTLLSTYYSVAMSIIQLYDCMIANKGICDPKPQMFKNVTNGLINTLPL